MDTNIIEHGEVTDDLAQRLLELGDLRAAVLRTQHEVWLQTDNLGITERREELKFSTIELHRQIAILEGEIDADKVKLKHLEIVIVHG